MTTFITIRCPIYDIESVRKHFPYIKMPYKDRVSLIYIKKIGYVGKNYDCVYKCKLSITDSFTDATAYEVATYLKGNYYLCTNCMTLQHIGTYGYRYCMTCKKVNFNCP